MHEAVCMYTTSQLYTSVCIVEVFESKPIGLRGIGAGDTESTGRELRQSVKSFIIDDTMLPVPPMSKGGDE